MRRTGRAGIGAEVALVAVHVAVAVGFDRLYTDGRYLGPLLGFTLGGHALATACRRRGFPAPVVAVLAVVGGALATTWLLFPSTAWLGLPTGATWTAAVESLRTARSAFPEVIAPTEVTPGFQVASGLALWLAVWFADWAAFRLRATIEAVAPAAVIFTFVSLLGSGAHEVTAAALFTAAVLAFVAAHRALRAQLDHAWLTTAPTAGPRAVLRAGGLVAVVAVVVGVVAGPHLPGARSEAAIEWRGHAGDDGPRVTISPMVEIKKRLVDQRTEELFTVRTSRPAYWRLTSLGEFDGAIFTSSGDYREADDDLPSDGPDPEATHAIRQHVQIEALAAIWAPAAYEAADLAESSELVRWDADSSTLIVDGETSDGLTYDVVSRAPLIDPDALRRAGDDDDPSLADPYEELPADFPDVVRRQAAEVTDGAVTRYDQALALQDWFRTQFRYSLDVPAGHGDNDLLDFLDSRQGYCEQFSATYAAMARSLGIPARVAVGFTPGEQDLEDPQLYHVRGLHAHAWPELWFPGVGWVPFEPTPGRGMPDAEAHTGVVPQQSDEAVGPTLPTTSTTAPGTTVPGSTTTPSATPTTAPDRTRTAVVPTASDGGDGGLPAPVLAVLVAMALVAAWLAAVLAAPAWRRRRLDAGDRDPVERAWLRSLDPIRWSTGLRPSPAETHLEFADRAAPPLGPAGTALRRLADLVTEVSWSDGPGPIGARAEADRLAAEVDQHAGDAETPRQRLRRRLSWHEAFGRTR